MKSNSPVADAKRPVPPKMLPDPSPASVSGGTNDACPENSTSMESPFAATPRSTADLDPAQVRQMTGAREILGHEAVGAIEAAWHTGELEADVQRSPLLSAGISSSRSGQHRDAEQQREDGKDAKTIARQIRIPPWWWIVAVSFAAPH